MILSARRGAEETEAFQLHLARIRIGLRQSAVGCAADVRTLVFERTMRREFRRQFSDRRHTTSERRPDRAGTRRVASTR